MLAIRSLAVPAMLVSFVSVTAAQSTSQGTVTIVTPEQSLPTITDEPPLECWREGASVMRLGAEAVGELHTALESASITLGLVPSVPCSVLAVLPSSLQDDFEGLETKWYDWWQTQRSNFSSWASTCTGQYAADPLFDFRVSSFLNSTSIMDNFTPRVTDCAEFTGAGVVTSTGGTASPGGPMETGSAGAAETAAAGENVAGSLRLQHRGLLCAALATLVSAMAVF